MQTVHTWLDVDYAKHVAWTTLEKDQVRPIDDASRLCHAISVYRGWWHHANGTPLDLNVGERIALMHSELSEALEGARKDLQSDHVPEFSMLEEELADLLIRVFDFAGAAQLRLGEAFVAKLRYNMTRSDHGHEARGEVGGKQF